MRNEKKYNKSIYFTMVFVQTIIHLVVLSEIFLKLFLIDHIVYDASSKIIIMDFIWIIILFLLETSYIYLNRLRKYGLQNNIKT